MASSHTKHEIEEKYESFVRSYFLINNKIFLVPIF